MCLGKGMGAWEDLWRWGLGAYDINEHFQKLVWEMMTLVSSHIVVRLVEKIEQKDFPLRR